MTNNEKFRLFIDGYKFKADHDTLDSLEEAMRNADYKFNPDTANWSRSKTIMQRGQIEKLKEALDTALVVLMQRDQELTSPYGDNNHPLER